MTTKSASASASAKFWSNTIAYAIWIALGVLMYTHPDLDRELSVLMDIPLQLATGMVYGVIAAGAIHMLFIL